MKRKPTYRPDTKAENHGLGGGVGPKYSSAAETERQKEIARIDSLYLSQRHSLDEWHKKEIYKINATYTDSTPVDSPTPNPALAFKTYDTFSEQMLTRLIQAIRLLGFFKEAKTETEFAASLRPRFSTKDTLVYLPMLSCQRSTTDLVCFFKLLEDNHGIKYGWLSVIPQHFKGKNNAFLTTETLTDLHKRISKKSYAPKEDIVNVIAALFSK